MILYYNKETNHWFHSDKKNNYFLGAKQYPIEQQEAILGSLTFSVREKNGRLGPLIGILVHYNEMGKFVGNEAFLSSLARKIILCKAIPVLLPFENIKNEQITGAIWDRRNQQWIQGQVPLPDCVFNRVSSRKLEKTKRFQEAISFIKEQQIPLFNPHFLDKFETYQLFQKNTLLRPLQPETIFVESREQLLAFLQTWKTIYLKPCANFKGNGLFIVKMLDGGKVSTRHYYKKDSFSNFQHFWRRKREMLLSKRFIAQQAIIPAKVNGRRYDYRILAHASDDTGYEIIGIGVRKAAPHNVTTHIPRGGRLLPYRSFQSETLDRQFHSIVNEVGKELTNHYGFFGEFSLDIGEAADGTLKIYEVNSKPMSFDEKPIEEKRLKHLCELFLQRTIFAD
ncbi:YheC/YheD family protein [Caldibacillus lycopersici]|uniref:YheC/YheD family protein n=1 Tax=Perspicuibacillus lycopersici TaxID=1325689 RepID=A0AAE3LLN3_9BACI|nr:YheC/YheD family protein [Perspicuibacillus lycopersici]MCU9612535.1 YheC/YheD family protein [Perspicuibacillus lycopersici]